MLKRAIQGKFSLGWNYFEDISVGREGFSTGDILHGGFFRGINSPGGILCRDNFTLGGGICGESFPERGGFQHDLKKEKKNQKLKSFQMKV